jgi:hypothetical protein
MKPSSVDIVFVMDTSESMRPCFEGLSRHLDEVVRPLQGFNFDVRLGLFGMSVGRGIWPLFSTVRGGGGDWWTADIYGRAEGLFTPDRGAFSSLLRSLPLLGDENHLFALDCALDFPFGPLATTRRVIALFSDERIEDGAKIFSGERLDNLELGKIPDLVTKFMARRVQFFGALPQSSALFELAATDGCQIEDVEGGDGLARVDFRKLLAQMARSISMLSLQGGAETYQRALFGQDLWQRPQPSQYTGGGGPAQHFDPWSGLR